MARDTAAIGTDVVIGENTPPVETTVEALIRQYNRQPLNSSLSTGDLVYWDATAGAWVRVAGTKSAGQLPVAQADGTVAWGNGSSLALDDVPVLYLPGVSGSYVSTPDHASLDVIGDIDLRAHIAPADWTPGVVQSPIAKHVSTADQRSYELRINVDGTLAMEWSPDGTGPAAKALTSTVAPTVADGADLWIRATLDVDNGASGHTVTFYTSNDGETWTQLGTAVTGAGVTSIHAGTAPLEVGSRESGGARLLVGKVYRAQVYNGIGGALVADLRCDLGNVGPRYRDSTGKVWTFNGSAWTWTGR